MKLLTEARKCLVAVLAAIGVATTALSDGSLSRTEDVAIALAFLGALGVFQVKNQDPVEVPE